MQALIFAILTIFSMPLSAQTLSAAQIRDDYFALKRNMSPLYKFEKININNVPTVVVYDCGHTQGVDYLGAEAFPRDVLPGWAEQVHLLAKSVVQLKNAAVFAKYPEEAWRSALMEQEDAWLNLIILHALKKEVVPPNVQYFDSLVDKMNWYRLKNGLSIPRLLSQDGCGAGDAQALIKTIPSATSVRFIPEFFAKICEATGRSNPSSCPYWVDIPSAKVSLSGLYRYIVVWTGSPERRGIIDFDKLLSGDETKVIEIRK